jgi:hypothetical protein
MKEVGKEKGMAKKSPMELNPSYVTTFDADGKATEEMVSDRKADAIEKSGKAKNKKGNVSAATVRRTGLSDYKHQMKQYDKKGGYKKQSSEQFLKKDYAKSDALKNNPKTATGNYNRAEKALKDSKTNPEVIAEEKKQAQKFPQDVRDAVRVRNIKKNRTTRHAADEISARGKEAVSTMEKKKIDARNKKQIKAKENKAAQAKDKKNSETKKKA